VPGRRLVHTYIHRYTSSNCRSSEYVSGTYRAGTREPRRQLSPRVACKSTWARVEALQRNQAFIDRYREARANHLAGREAIFPAGTWWLPRFAGVKCAEANATAPPS
jgi:hypothetical protein